MLRMNHAIALIGFKACGKSTIGKALAHCLDRQWTDTDQDIEAYYYNQHHQHLSCKEIVRLCSIDYFKALESIIFKQLNPTCKSIISTGGSSFLNTNNHRYLPEHCQVIYLKTDLHTLIQRWKTHPPPWLVEDITHPHSQKAIDDRHQRYKELAHHTIDTTGCNIETICHHILKKITP